MRYISLLIISLIISISAFSQNRLNSRLFYLKPPLHNSPSKLESVYFGKYAFKVSEPVDKRSDFYGEVVYKKKRVERLDEFFSKPTMIEIQDKIISDLKSLGVLYDLGEIEDMIVINPIVEVFYPDVRGFVWAKSFAKVRLRLRAVQNDKILIENVYESFYITNGSDKEFEGSMLMTIEEGANVTIGIALRKALDEFYNDLNSKLKN